jgi:hypothetical protein
MSHRRRSGALVAVRRSPRRRRAACCARRSTMGSMNWSWSESSAGAVAPVFADCFHVICGRTHTQCAGAQGAPTSITHAARREPAGSPRHLIRSDEPRNGSGVPRFGPPPPLRFARSDDSGAGVAVDLGAHGNLQDLRFGPTHDMAPRSDALLRPCDDRRRQTWRKSEARPIMLWTYGLWALSLNALVTPTKLEHR